jgi:hypothetical protein
MDGMVFTFTGPKTRVVILGTLIFWLFSLIGCASFKVPIPLDMSFKARAQVVGDDDVHVKAALLTAEESENVFGVNLISRWIQPVWIEVTNTSARPFWFLSPGTDADYYAPNEIAYIYHAWYSNKANKKMAEHFQNLSFKNPIHPGGKKTGFVFMHFEQDLREVTIDLVAHESFKSFSIISKVTALKGKSLYAAEGIYADSDIIRVDDESLKRHLEQLPCCTTSDDGKLTGDPLNIVLIGSPQHLGKALIRRGWHQAEETYWGSVWKTINSFLFGKEYLYSPVSPLYALGRKQDYAAQKAHGAINRRNHFRIWLTPLRFGDKEVWIGQISRDIGVRFTTKSKNFVTHKIDPDVDEAREALMYDLILSNYVEKIGYVVGVGECPTDVPCQNLTGDPFFTDGLRAVILLHDKSIPITEMQFFPWAHPEGDRQIF